MPAAAPAPMIRIRDGKAQPGERHVPEETPVAIVHDASTYAVMMATPEDLEDLAVGLSLTEGVIDHPDQVRAIDVVHSDLGVEVRLWLGADRAAALAVRRRTMAGPTGCGLCGVESLEQMRAPARQPPRELAVLTTDQVQSAMAAIEPFQVLGRDTRAAHAAGLWTPGAGMVLVREDVGRHNAVDKLAGALARQGLELAGVLVLTSRVSVELVQKASAMRCAVIVAVSAPTRLAVETAAHAGITLIAVARQDGFEIFTHPDRIA